MKDNFLIRPNCRICLNCMHFQNLYNFDHIGICNKDKKEKIMSTECNVFSE